MSLPLDAREYKVMLNHRWFQTPTTAVQSFWEEVTSLAQSLGFETKGSLDLNPSEARTVEFFDTVDFSLHRAGIVLRQRTSTDKVELTLKAVSPDSFIAQDADIQPALETISKLKFEEDIGPPWRPRYSRSSTVELKSQHGLCDTSTVLADAAKFFPSLLQLEHDEIPLSPQLRLYRVNALCAYETIYDGAKLVLDGEKKSSVALILWATSKKGRPLVAEFSFRIKRTGEEFLAIHCRQAMRLFEGLQLMDWYLPHGMTKTQYAYRSRHAQES